MLIDQSPAVYETRAVSIFALLICLAWPQLASANASAAYEALSGEATVELQDGRTFSGDAVSFRDEVLMLRSRIDRGEVDRGFPKDRIARLRFPGEGLVAEAIEMIDDGKTAAVIPLIEPLWRQRAPFLPLVDLEVLELFAALAAAHRKTGDPYRAISLASRLIPHARSPEISDSLYETLMAAHFDLEFYDDTEQLARKWISEQGDPPRSALGWRFLAEMALQDQKFEEVAWIVLQPIAIAGPEPKNHLDVCYALAIHAFHQKEEFQRAVQLRREMEELGLDWPPGEALRETGEVYSLMATGDGTPPESPVLEPDLDLRPAEEDLNLPLEEVRKSIRPDNP